MVWACMVASETRSLVFTDDDVTPDRSRRINSSVYRATLSAQIQSNAANAANPTELHSAN